MKKIKNIIICLIVLLFISFFVHVIYLSYHGQKEFIKSHYNGVILEIRKLEGRRDLPDIRINDKWLSIDINESKIKNYIKVGDSIVKDSGTEEIKVYRMDENNNWKVKIFK